MKKNLLVMFALLISVCVNIAFAANNSNPESTIATQLLKTSQAWDGSKYLAYPAGQPEITVLKIKIPAHTALPWHTHPMPNAAYVLSGTLDIENKNGAHKTLHAGDAVAETVNTVHRGITGDQPVELIVFYAGAVGMPTAKPASK